jgi:hypothetical protein
MWLAAMWPLADGCGEHADNNNIIDVVILITGQCGSVPNSKKHTLSLVCVYEDDDSYDKTGPPGSQTHVHPIMAHICLLTEVMAVVYSSAIIVTHKRPKHRPVFLHIHL